MKNTGLPKDECCPRSFLISECRLADLSSSHRTLSSDHSFMPHSAAMPYCIRKPLCLPGPQPLCPSVFASHLLTVGIRHAPIIQAMYPPVALCRLGHPRHLQVLSELGSRLSSLSTTPLPCASKLKGTSWRHECWFYTDHSSGFVT